ncbi:hypothetical protein C8Q78DRAFT_1076903 [Trametes maxima]|nr:hypothetical protein C8Q78DRAFT_1076903 [Trametes maxima]
MFYLPSPPILDCLHPYKAHLALATAGPLPPSTPLLSVPPSDVVVQADLFALTRPPPVHPPALPLNLPAQLLSNATNVLLSPVLPAEAVGSPQRHQGLLEKRSFRQRMDDKLKEEWDTSRATWDAKLRGEAQKRENKWRIDHSFFIWHWRKDGEQPTRLCVQGVQTLPNFTLAQDPSVMTRLDITKDDEIDMYQPRYGLWQTQAVNEAFTITPKQTLLFRSVGVKSCPLFDILRAEVTRKAAYGLPLTEPQAVQVTIVAPKPLRTPKRKHTDDVASMQGTPTILRTASASATAPTTPASAVGLGLGLSSLSTQSPISSSSRLAQDVFRPVLVLAYPFSSTCYLATLLVSGTGYPMATLHISVCATTIIITTTYPTRTTTGIYISSAPSSVIPGSRHRRGLRCYGTTTGSTPMAKRRIRM